MQILALDVGGTKVAYARGTQTSGRIQLTEVKRLAVKDFPSFETILKKIGTDNADKISIGVAGPVRGRTVQMTNLPWVIDADNLSTELAKPVFLINDLGAYAHSISYIEPNQFDWLQGNHKSPPTGNRALIAAGTGLGEALAILSHTSYQGPSTYLSVPSEGGHASFAPQTAEDRELLEFLSAKYTHVSWERVVSGLDGFRNLFDFFLLKNQSPAARELQHLTQGKLDIGPDVLRAYEDGVQIARKVVETFIRLYGAEAGNLALKSLPYGGLYIAGGIALRLDPKLLKTFFMQGFSAKGRFENLLKDIPVALVKEPHAALIGLVALASL